MRSIAALFIKDIRLYGRKFISTVCMLCLLLLGCAVALGAVLGQNSKTKSKTSLALVDKDASTLSQMAIGVISESEGVVELFDMHSAETPEEAVSGINDGKYGGAIIFEEDYISRILDGESEAVKIVITEEMTDAAQMITHFAVTGEKLIKVAEYGIMSTWKPLRKVYTVDETHDILAKAELIYALRLLSIPEKSFAEEKMPYADSNVGIAEYYILAFAAFLMILLEVVFFSYTAADCEYSMLRRIRSYKISGAVLVFEKAFFPFIARGILLFGIMFLLKKYVSVSLNAEIIVFTLMGLFIFSVFFSSLSVLLSQTPLGISIIFAIGISGLFLGGGLIPLSMLPNEAIEIGKYTPSGFCEQMLAPMFDGKTDISVLFVPLIVSAVMFVLAVLYTRRICEKGGGAK